MKAGSVDGWRKMKKNTCLDPSTLFGIAIQRILQDQIAKRYRVDASYFFFRKVNLRWAKRPQPTFPDPLLNAEFGMVSKLKIWYHRQKEKAVVITARILILKRPMVC